MSHDDEVFEDAVARSQVDLNASEIGISNVDSVAPTEAEDAPEEQNAPRGSWSFSDEVDSDEPVVNDGNDGQSLGVVRTNDQILPVQAAAPLPVGQRRSRLMHVLRPQGHWNQRVILIGLVALGVGFFLVWGNDAPNSLQKSTNSLSGQPSREVNGLPRREEVKPYKIAPSGGALVSSPELGAPGPAVGSGPNDGVGGGMPYGQSVTAPRVIIPTSPPPAIPKNGLIASANTNGSTGSTQNGGFAIKTRAGLRAEEKAALQAEDEMIPKAPAVENQSVTGASARIVLPRGLRIPLVLAEPVRSGIATSVGATVIHDIKDTAGKTIIPVGTSVMISFSPQEVNGRIINDRRSGVVFTLPDGTQVTNTGTVKGADGFAGLAGRVRKTGGRSILRRMTGTVARAGAGVIGSETGGLAPNVADITEGNSTDFAQSEVTVEVPAGTRCTLIIGV
ncbi:MAG: hypothetical protein ACRD63_01485 [Pyrinomonadaceae bacterium]